MNLYSTDFPGLFHLLFHSYSLNRFRLVIISCSCFWIIDWWFFIKENLFMNQNSNSFVLRTKSVWLFIFSFAIIEFTKFMLEGRVKSWNRVHDGGSFSFFLLLVNSWALTKTLVVHLSSWNADTILIFVVTWKQFFHRNFDLTIHGAHRH